MTRKPNVILISTDQQRGDCIGAEGRGVRTPNLDRIGRAGGRFSRCITPHPMCQAARASILTGKLPYSHGVRDNGRDLDEALAQHKEVDTIVNFASFRSVYESTTDILAQKQIRTVAIIAEGVPEQQSKMLIDAAAKADVTIIGPATVGGIKPGAFRIGNTGGMIDNIISSKLYRPGHVAYVSKSGGMSNELNNIIAHNADGVFEGVAIGGDRYPGTVFLDHLLRFEANPGVAMLVLLGEVGGVEEYRICEAIRDGRIKKPIVAW